MLADGTVEAAPDPHEVRAALAQAKAEGYDAVAIVFMHAYRYPAHERAVGAIARALGFAQVSESHASSALIKFVSRGDTTAVDAYLSPIIARYVGKVSRALDVERTGARVMFMMSSGGLTSANLFAGKDAILSGPAGGVVAMARTRRAQASSAAIGFDMGGTSTDVAHYDGEFERAFETEVAGVRMRAPMMKIHTVAAGGGSILHFDGARYRVGPDSAGADPGPACYRRGGPLAVTDANVMTGKLIPDFFPKVFGPNGDQPLDENIVRKKFEALAREIGDGRISRGGRGRLPFDCGRQNGRGNQDDFGRARLRRDALRAELVRRRRRPARLRRRRRAQRCDRAHPSALLAALGLRNGAGRHRRAARARRR